MRRIVLLATLAAVAAGLAVSAVGLAGDRPARPADASRPAASTADTPREGPFALAAEQGRAREIGSRHDVRAGHAGLHARIVGDLADRLDVPESRLRAALRDVRQRARGRGVRPLGASPEQLAELKRRVSGDLAGELGVPVSRVVAAVRAELEHGLGVAVGFGAITPSARDRALACFDDPAGCDVAALRRQIRLHGRGR